MGGKEAAGEGDGLRAPVVGARRPRPAFPAPAGCERPRARGEIRAEPTRAGDSGARLRGGDGPSAARGSPR